MQDATHLSVLLATAVTIAAGHTALGVDHTLPFIALGRARAWTLQKTLLVTALCGAGHVGSSVLLAGIGMTLGLAAQRFEWVQSMRGSVAAWSLIAFGAFFIVRALVRTARGKAHSHVHEHADGIVHDHHHDHVEAPHLHPHEAAGMPSTTVWTLFIVFAFGPCEPLIPLVMAPAALGDWLAVTLVVAAFSVVTIAVMLTLVAAGYLGASRVHLAGLERHAELLAGIAIAGSGFAVQLFGI